MMESVPKSEFVHHLIMENKLHACGFGRFIFFHGMLFGSREKWWGAPGLRASSHEGLDLCFFENNSNEQFRLDETVSVPMLYDGRVEHITNDFLGKTVISSHSFDNSEQPALLSLYGHLNVDKNLQVGDAIKEGQVFAKISGFENRKKLLLPHLHISLARPENLPPANHLEWDFLNKVDRSVFIDPLNAINARHMIIEYDNGSDLSKIFTKCSRIAALQ